MMRRTTILIALAALAVMAPSAHASVTIESFTAGPASTLAGAHSDASTSFAFQVLADPGFQLRTVGGAAQDIVVRTPRGLVGDVSNVPKCPRSLFAASAMSQLNQQEGTGGCPPDSQVGLATIPYTEPSNSGEAVLGVYNVQPGPGEPALLGIQGFVAKAIVVPIHLSVDASDGYAVTATVESVPRQPANVSTLGANITLWAVPGAHERRAGGSETRNPGEPESTGAPELIPPGLPSQWKPFMQNPTDCSELPLTHLRVNTYEEPDIFTEATAESPIPTECQNVPFNPSVTVTPETSRAGSPTGLGFDLNIPQNWNDPNGIGTSALKKAVITLPEGMTMSPSAADGLGGCTPSQIGIGNDNPATCPDSAKIGTVEVSSPLLPEGEGGAEGALTGSVYLGKPEGGPNTGPPYTIYLDVAGHGLDVKLRGTVVPDPQTGQITTTFDDNPELPFDHFRLQFKGGPRAPLVNPPDCGRQVTTTELTPYAAPGEPAKPTSTFTTSYDGSGANCPASRPFAPTVEAGTESPSAGKTSPFVLRLSRPDGDQPLSAINVTTPPGFSAYLKGVPYCPEAAIAAAQASSGTAEAASPSCPAASQVGTVTTGAGAGPNPFYVSGKAYLAGPYKGAPVSIVFITPALAGPFDLGDVVVRAALYVNPETAQVTVRSDPLPQILGGVPLQLRSVAVAINRPHFTTNPTSCDPLSVATEAVSLFAVPANLSTRFQVGGCSALGFSPKLSLTLKGGTKRNRFPALTATLTQPEGQANIRYVQALLPHSEFLEQGHIGTICTRVQFNAVPRACPAESVYGHAKAWSPLLEAPLEGPVYLRANGGERELPDLVAALKGPVSQPIEIDLVGYIDSKHARIRNTFALVPDAPVSKFVLSMQGGKKGLLVNSENLCKIGKAKREAAVRVIGQNNKRADQSPLVQNQCSAPGPKSAKKNTSKRLGTSHR